MCSPGQRRSRIPLRQQQLRYNKNIDTCRKSAADINTKHHGLCKPVTVYMVGSCVHRAATITDTVAGNNSCDTIRTLTLAVNPLLTSTQNITVCANQLPYTWLGHVFTGQRRSRIPLRQQQLRYNKNIDTCRKSAADINTKHHGLCKPVTVYLVGSCVHRAATITDTVAATTVAIQ
jgi:uncharacterized protein YlaI